MLTRRCSLKALKDSCGPQVYCPSQHCYQPDHQGKLEETVQEQEIQAPRLEAQEDSRHPSSFAHHGFSQNPCVQSQDFLALHNFLLMQSLKLEHSSAFFSNWQMLDSHLHL